MEVKIVNLLLPALLIGLAGVIVFSAGIFLGKLLATIQRISNGLYRPLSLDFIDQVMVYLPRPRQLILYLRHPKQMISYLRNDAPVTFVFIGASLILVAAVIVTIAVFWRALG